MSDVRKYSKKRVYKNKTGGTKKNVRFDSSVKPEDENAKIYHNLPHSSILVRNDIQKFTDGSRNESNMIQKYEDMYSDIIGSKKWMDSDNPKWDRVYKRINRVAENTSRNSKLGGKKRKTRKNKKQFLYNPNDPSKSFDVYIDKNPKDTIPIKYTTVKDVKDTISKLEKLYKNKKYPHKRIWQVGMIMKVRLGAMKKHRKSRYPNAKNVTARYNLANKYFKRLGKRAKELTKKRKATKKHIRTKKRNK